MTSHPRTPAPRRRVRVARLAFVLSLTTLSIAVLAAQPAVAQTAPTVGIEVQAGDGSTSTGISIADLYPGATQEAVLFLTGRRADEVDDVAVTLSGLEDLENGCNRPETNTGDTSCGDGPDQGELSRWLAVTYTGGIETTGRTGRACTIPAGTSSTTDLMIDLATLGAVNVAPPANRSDGAVRCVVLEFHHEDRGPGDNVTQTDSVRFDLRIDFSGELAQVRGGGEEPNEGALPPGGGNGVDLPTPVVQPPAIDLPPEVGGAVIDNDPDPADPNDPDRVTTPDGPRTVSPDQVVSAGETLRLGLPRTGSTVVVELLAVAFLLLALGALILRRRDRSDQEVTS